MPWEGRGAISARRDSDHWVGALGELHRDVGVDAFVFWPADGGEEEQIRAFAEVAAEMRAEG